MNSGHERGSSDLPPVPPFAVVGVTGLPCSGKSLAAGLIARGEVPGFPAGRLFMADDDGHRVLERPEVVATLRRRFGDAAFRSDEPKDVRRAIAERVFTDPAELAWLEGVVHPLVVADSEAAIARERGVRPVVIEAALLFAADMDARCDRILLIEADFAVRLGRAARRGWSREELQRREMRQIPLFTAARERDSGARIVPVRNNGDIDELKQALSEALRQPKLKTKA